jgi:hypothetical protein
MLEQHPFGKGSKMSFWGKACAAAAGVTGVYVGVAKGAYDAATGKGSFQDGWSDTIEKMVDGGRKVR